MVASLRATVAPRLPDAKQTYDVSEEAKFRRVLNLYFAQLDNVSRALLSLTGGQYLNLPSGSFQSIVTQTASAANTPKLIALEVTDYANGIYRVIGDGIHTQQDGVYNLQFSLQLTNTDPQPHDMGIWLRKNGVDIPYTSSIVTVSGTHGGNPGYYIVAANFFVPLTTTDYVELWWSTNDVAVQLNALPPITTPFVNPGAPSAVVTLSFVSAIPT
jgi:hypothetical protein